MKATFNTTLGNDMGTIAVACVRGSLGNRLIRAVLLAVAVTCALAFATFAAAFPADLALWEQVGTQTKLTSLGCIVLFAALFPVLVGVAWVTERVIAPALGVKVDDPVFNRSSTL